MASAGTANSQRDNRRVRQRAGNKKNHHGAHRRVRNASERARARALARGWASTNHRQRDERQIDTGCFKTSAIDNRNRSRVAVARGFRVNLAPHSIPVPAALSHPLSLLLPRVFPPSLSLSLSFSFPPLLFTRPTVIILPLALSRSTSPFFSPSRTQLRHVHLSTHTRARARARGYFHHPRFASDRSPSL